MYNSDAQAQANRDLQYRMFRQQLEASQPTFWDALGGLAGALPGFLHPAQAAAPVSFASLFPAAASASVPSVAPVAAPPAGYNFVPPLYQQPTFENQYNELPY